MTISITQAAAQRIKSSLQKRGKGIGLRIGIKTSGCSGLAYKLEFVDTAQNDDEVFHSHDVTVFIDKKSLAFLDGTTLDYAREGVQEGFKFNNPNAKAECGCGESFTV